MSSKIFIVEDHPTMRQMMREFIEAISGMEVCGVAATAEEGLEYLVDLEVDLVTVDISLPGMNGIDLVAKLQARWPQLPCIIVSGHHEPGYIKRAFAEGARGYVAKGNPMEIRTAIEQVLAGKIYLNESMRKKIPCDCFEG
jgi:DNA-binding NarL/FixJ family response regulator